MSRFVWKNINFIEKSGLIHDVKNKTFKKDIAIAKGKTRCIDIIELS